MPHDDAREPVEGADVPETREAALDRFDRAIAAAIGRLRDLEVPDAVMTLMADRAERLNQALAASQGSRSAWGFTTGGDNPAVSGVFVIGLAPFPALESRMSTTGDLAEGIVVFGDAFEGPAGAAHGGHIAKLLDDLSAIARSVATPAMALTRQLNITYHRPTPLHRPLDVRATVTHAERRRTTVHATIHDGEALCAEAHATFVAPRQGGSRQPEDRS